MRAVQIRVRTEQPVLIQRAATRVARVLLLLPATTVKDVISMLIWHILCMLRACSQLAN